MSDKIKVAFDYQIFCQQRFGGVSRYFCELVEGLSKSDRFLPRIFAPLHFNRHLLDSCAPVSGFYLNANGKYIRRAIRDASALITPYLLNRFSPSVLHETYYSSSPQKWKCGARVVTIHDMINEKFIFNRSVQEWETNLKRLAVSKADAIICVSENTRSDLIELFNVPIKKTFVVHHGISNFGELKLPDMSAPIVPRPYILFVGNRDGYKNFNRLLDAFSSSTFLRNEVALIAFGGGKFTQSEVKYIIDIGLSLSRIQQINGSDSILHQLYKDAQCFAYPSLYEGFGFPVLEAMSCGCPVVCSNNSSLPEVAGNAALLFDPTCADSIRSSLEIMLSDSRLRDHCITEGRYRAKLFSWTTCVNKTQDIYSTFG